jgi:cysteine desulfurase
MRSGTLNVPGIVGFGCAAEICRTGMGAESGRAAALRGRLLDGLQQRIAGITVNGSLERRVPQNLNISIADVEGESLLMGLDDVAVSAGAACTSASVEPSHVLTAIGVPLDLARASIRFGIGRYTTAEEIDYVIDKIASVVGRLRGMSPFADLEEDESDRPAVWKLD